MTFSIILHYEEVEKLMDFLLVQIKKITEQEGTEYKDVQELHDFYEILYEEYRYATERSPDCEFKFDICELLESQIFTPKGWEFVEVRELKINDMVRP